MKRWLLLLLTVVAALAFVAVPALLIDPFRPQTAGALETGYRVRAWAPWATPPLAALSVLAAALIWRRGRRLWAKALAALLVVPVLAAAWFVRQNPFEWMFEPLAAPAYAGAHEADFVRGEDMVLAVEGGGERVAYPVRLLAYHHLVADAVGGVPVVATY